MIVDRIYWGRADSQPGNGVYWSTKFGYPYRIISDSGGVFRKTFKEKLKIVSNIHTVLRTTLKAIHLQRGQYNQ